MTLTFGSLFAGIGGLDLGLERSGMQCRWQVEIDDYATKVLEKHWPDVDRFRDIRDCGTHNLASVDLICGGFPCQPHSVAGKRRGASDDRNLWPEYLRIVKELRPRYVLAENVPGIVTTYLDQVLSDLEGETYTCATLNLPAVAFDAPHRRERVFIVAYSQYDGHIKTTKQCEIERMEQFQRRTQKPSGVEQSEGGHTRPIVSENVAYAQSERLEGRLALRNEITTQGVRLLSTRQSESCGSDQWTVEPNVGRMVNGIPNRVDRLKCLGNAVVPAVAEWIGERILICHLANIQERD